ncbi:hypothetical protein [Williamsia sp. 1135]|uniref:hypothetical protein n=1 Tax=Williamsia sp. 1135 TaxID=1889262 RepID=UPI000A11362A|nr:hypothetical protein [Williamsia sp. 1135]ORM25879.1 hypothetical protein BFL43_23345 [Williamsia sp. 1135]
MSIADLFDSIAERARTETESAVRTYRDQQRALEERLRIAAENADHRRGSTRAAMAARGAILLPADDIDLSPHTPAPGAPGAAPVPAAVSSPTAVPVAEEPRPPHRDVGKQDGTMDFSFSSGWLTDR